LLIQEILYREAVSLHYIGSLVCSMHENNSHGGPGKPIDPWVVGAMLCLLAIPAIPTLRAVRHTVFIDVAGQHASPLGYTISLSLFVIPILVIGLWLLPQSGKKIPQKAFWTTIAILFPLGAALDFFFATRFFVFPEPAATLGLFIPAWRGSVPVEEYIFYLTGFMAVLLLYLWLDEYWLCAYSVPSDVQGRTQYHRLVRFHPASLIVGLVLVGVAFVLRRLLQPDSPGIPGYFIFIVITALGPSTLLLPSARPMINWRAFSLTLYIIALTSLLWEATLALPYGWWGYQRPQMIGLSILAWDALPVEAVVVWLAVTFTTVITYETVKSWQASGKEAREAFFGRTPDA
jgi:hypothetical protein